MKFSFPKSERLCSQKVIETLFATGKEIRKFPFTIRFLEVKDPEMGPSQIVISVPKRRAKRAVDRNRLRRQIKEAYRLSKAPLVEQLKALDKQVVLFLIYTGKEKEEYSFIAKKLSVLLKELMGQLQ